MPQGTFTADFLLSTEKRKPIFDTILKVEEYRQTYKQSNSLRRYAEAQVQRLKDLIAQYEESLQSWDELQNRSQQLQTEITQGNEQLTRLEAQAKALAQQRQTLVAQSEQVQQTQNQLTLLTHKLENQQQAVSRLGNALQQAESAAQICKEQQKSYDQFLAAEAQLKELGIAQKQQQKERKKQANA